MTSSFHRRSFLVGGASLALAIGAGWPRDTGAQTTDVPAFASPVAMPSIDPREDGPLEVVTSTSILADFARQIGGKRVDVRSILPANGDPHDFEPSPDDVITIESADLLILHGLHLDSWVDSLIDAAQTDAPIVVATTGIETIHGDEDHDDDAHDGDEGHDGGEEDDDHGDDHEFSEGDPHVWFDPMRAIQMAANIRDGLSQIDSDGAAGYQQRYEAYASALEQLDRDIQASIDLIPEDRRILVTNHDALGYYADRYGLTIVGTVIPGMDSRTEPSAKEIAALIESIQAAGVTVIFAENTVDPALAESLASDAGIRVAPDLYTDSLGDEGSGAETYIGLMETDTIIIVENLRST